MRSTTLSIALLVRHIRGVNLNLLYGYRLDQVEAKWIWIANGARDMVCVTKGTDVILLMEVRDCRSF